MFNLKNEKDLVKKVNELLRWKNIELTRFSPLKIYIYDPFQSGRGGDMLRTSKGALYFKNNIIEKGFEIAYTDEKTSPIPYEDIIQDCKEIVIKELYGDGEIIGKIYGRYFEILPRDNKIYIINIHHKEPIKKTLDSLINNESSNLSLFLLENGKKIKYISNQTNIEDLIPWEFEEKNILEKRLNLLIYHLSSVGLETQISIKEDLRISFEVKPKIKILVGDSLKDGDIILPPKKDGRQLSIFETYLN